MNYYKLSFSCNTKDTGSVYPQVQKMNDSYDYKGKNSVYALSRCHDSFPDFEPNLDGFILHGKAKLTDFISNGIISSTGVLLSEKAKNILETSHLQGCKFYNAKILYKESIIDYFWMHFISNVRISVNYKKSGFFIIQNFSTKIENIDVESEEDLINKEKHLQENNPGKTLAIWADEINLDSSFDKQLDLFKVGKFDSYYYVSNRLRNFFDEQNITGIEYLDATNIKLS